MKDIIYNAVLYFPVKRYEKNFKKNIGVLEGTLETLRQEKKRAEGHGALSLAEVHNTGIYLVLFNFDLTVLMKLMLLERNESIRKVYAKQLALLIYEMFEDFSEIFGKNILEVIKGLPQKDKLMHDFKEIGQGLRNYKKVYEKELRNIRNIVVAHRDHDGNAQIQALSEIDTKEIQILAGEIETWNWQVVKLLTDLTNDYRKSWIMIKEIAKNCENH